MQTRRQHGFALLPMAWMWLIWRLSADPASGTKSLRLARWIWAHLLTPVLGIVPTYPVLFVTDTVARKAAHVMEYAILAGLLLLALSRSFPEKAPAWLARWAWLIAIAWAAVDELHQSFVPGRAGRVSDVAVDAVGITLLVAGWLWYRRRHQGRSAAA